MSLPQAPKPAKLVIGVFLKKRHLLNSAAKRMSEKFGEIDMVSPWLAFDYTSYYEREMGKPLFRRIFTFKKLINQETFSLIKLWTNQLEIEYSTDNNRSINIDPGYMLQEKFVLSTGKNFSHRIYIGKGIYADLTLIYSKGAFQTLPWTYPDYASQDILNFLTKVRKKYTADLRSAD